MSDQFFFYIGGISALLGAIFFIGLHLVTSGLFFVAAALLLYIHFVGNK